MSVFNGDDNQNTSNSQTNENKSNQSFVQKLVETRGDQWSDPEVIAKGKIESDAYIEQLKQEIAVLKEQNTKSTKIDSLISSIEQKAAETTTAEAQSNNQGGANESNTKTIVSEDDIQVLIEEALTKKELRNTVRQNLEQVNSQLDQMFGTEADVRVGEKARELGLSKERLQEIASESPSAFFSLIGEKPKDLKPLTNGSIRTESVNMQSGGKRNNAYYQNLRKTNPREFAKQQGQMIKDRVELGDNFYK